MQHSDSKTDPKTPPTGFDAPGRGGFVPEKLLGRTGDDFDSTAYSTLGLEEICLENIVMASLNQDILKRNFEIIINALKLQAQKLSGVYKHFNNYEDMIAEVKESLFHNDKKLQEIQDKNHIEPKQDTGFDKSVFSEEFIKLKEKDIAQQKEINELKEKINENLLESSGGLKGLEQHLYKHDDDLKMQETQANDIQLRMQDFEHKFDDFSSKFNEIQSKFDSFESKIHLIESLKSSSEDSNEGPNLAGIINQISLFRNQLKDYVLLDDFNAFKDFFANFNSDISKTLKKVEPIDINVNEIEHKEIPELKTMIEAVNNQTSNQELDFMKKLSELEEKLSEMIKKAITDDKPEIIREKTPPLPQINMEVVENDLKAYLAQELARKVNMEDYYQVLRDVDMVKEGLNILSAEIAGLNEMRNHDNNDKVVAPKPVVQNMFSSKESNQLKDLINKVNDLESLLRKAQKEINDVSISHGGLLKEAKEHIKELDEKKLDKSEIKIEKIEELLKKANSLEGDIKIIKDHQFSLEKTVSMHEMSINDVMKELAKFKKKTSVNDQQILSKDMVNRLIEDALGKLRKDVDNLLGQISQNLNKKSEFEDLWKSEGKTLEKLDELVNLFTKKYCDKNETKKAFIYIENKISQLFTAVFGEKEDTENDALLAKKPLLWSCASCDKELDKFQGKLGDYKGWAQFPPKNTSPERMGKFGVGYNRMIEDRKDNSVKDWEKIKLSNMLSNADTTKSISQSNMFPELPKKKEKRQGF